MKISSKFAIYRVYLLRYNKKDPIFVINYNTTLKSIINGMLKECCRDMHSSRNLYIDQFMRNFSRLFANKINLMQMTVESPLARDTKRHTILERLAADGLSLLNLSDSVRLLITLFSSNLPLYTIPFCFIKNIFFSLHFYTRCFFFKTVYTFTLNLKKILTSLVLMVAK